jgi:hypothetical protein
MEDAMPTILQSQHYIVGHMLGATGGVTFCNCGHAFFVAYEGLVETEETRQAALEAGSERCVQHCTTEQAKEWP